jgi:hypothetical protein
MNSRRLPALNVRDTPTSYGQRIGDQRAMISRHERLGAHDRGHPFSRPGVSFGGNSSGVFCLGKASCFAPLTALLRRLGVPAPARRTALQELMAEPRHKIPNMILTQDHFRALGLND